MYYRDLVFSKLIYNLKSEASKTYLGYAWWILEPMLFVFVFYLVFEKLLQRGGPGFLVFLLCGNIPYLWFSKTVSNASNSILGGHGLITQVRISKAFFPLMVVLTDAVKQFFVFVFLFAFLVWYGLEAQTSWLYVPVLIIVELSIIISVAMVSAAITPFFPDLKYIIPTGLTLLMFGSGIFYSYREVVSEEHQRLFMMNPIANLIENYRMVMIQGVEPDWVALGFIFCIATVIAIGMLYFFRVASSTYSKLVVQ